MGLYAWGANSHGQLGVGYVSEMCTVPQEVTNLPVHPNDIKSMAGGGGHIIILDKFGKLYSCGWNNKGQLGLGDGKDTYHLKLITHPNIQNVRTIACGWDTSLAITDKDKLFVWGSNLYNQLGQPKEKLHCINVPIELNLPNNETILDANFGLRHTCVLTKSNKIYIFGKSKCCSILRKLNTCKAITHNGTEYLYIQLNEKIISVSSGQTSVIYLCKNNILGFGDNKFSQIFCDTNDIIQHEIFKELRSGWTHNACLTESGNVYLWGRNNYGQLGKDPQNIGTTISKLQKLNIETEIIDISLGSEHGMVLNEFGEIFTWGWNEHGNCGNGQTINLCTPTLIPLPGRSTHLTAGAGFCYVLCNK